MSSPVQNTPQFLFRTRAEICLRVGIALVLLVAAFAKAHQLATTPSLGDGVRFNQLVVLEELAFSVWLLSGLLPKLSWFSAVLCFTTFTSVSGYKYWIGEGSCGCFGAATVPPLWTALFDMTVVGLLILFRPVGLNFHRKEVYQELIESKKKVVLAGFVWLLIAVPSAYAMMSIQKNDIAELGTEFIGADGRKTILLEPEKWVGKELPLLPYIEPDEVRDKLKTGVWTMVLYHHDCPKCKATIDKLIEKKSENVVCVEVSPIGVSHIPIEDVLNLKLMMKRNVFAETPVVLFLTSSIVRAKES